MRAAPLFLLSSLFLASLFPGPASAGWPPLGRALSIAPKSQEQPKIATDGSGGAIVVWHDLRSTRVNVFARRVFASGELDPAWPIDGRALLTDSTALAGQQNIVVVTDGARGAIVAWQDARNAVGGPDIFAQHVLVTGVVDPAWPANGRALCTAAGPQAFPRITSDGAGGAIVTWMDFRSGATDADIYAQRVQAFGVVDPAWPVNGVALSTAPESQALPEIAPDGSGGAIVAWYDVRSSATSADIYAQHALVSGVVDPAWPANGRALCLAPRDQINPTIVSDAAHGAIVTWQDLRDGVQHIYAQRVLGSGAIAAGWPVDGRAVCTAALEQTTPHITSDGASGAIVTWEDFRSGTNHNPFAQHVLASGAIDAAWPVNGRALSLSGGEASSTSIVADGAGGAIIAWDENSFVMANHVLASGRLDPSFPVNGRFMRLLLTFQHSPDLVGSGAGSAIVAWADSPTGPNFDIYAMIVLTEVAAGVDPRARPPEFTFAHPSPNPGSGAVTLRFALPRTARVRLAIYDVAGRRVRQIADGEQAMGEHEIAWDHRDEAGRTVSTGFYFARLEVDGRVLTQKLVTLK